MKARMGESMRFLQVMLLLLMPAFSPAAAVEIPDRTAEAQEFVELLHTGRFADAAKRFDETMSAALPAEKLQAVWESLEEQAGSFLGQAGTRIQDVPGYHAVLVACHFERAWLDAKVVFDGQGRVAGLFFLPGKTPAEEKEENDLPEGVTEEEISFGLKGWELPGTMTLPPGDGPFPAAVLVHGSGPSDRNESVGANQPFRDLAHGLAAAGVASLRYDKRTLVHGARMIGLPITVVEETVEDAVAAVAFLREHPRRVRVDRIFIIGHSLGASMAPRIARTDPKIAGLVMLAGFTRPLEELLVEQLTYLGSLDGTVDSSEQANIDAAVAGRDRLRAELAELPDGEMVLGVPASYWKDMRAYDPVQVAASLPCPMLILQGRRDYQVTVEDLEGWRRGLGSRDDVLFRVYPDLNHLFLAGEGPSTPGEYAVPGRVADQVIRDISSWIRSLP